jgi:hypothetical protein
MVLLALAIQIAIAVFILFLCAAFFYGAPFVPTRDATAEKMLEFAKIKPSDYVIDLGSGDGRLLFLASKAKPHYLLGIEINPWLVIACWFRSKFYPIVSRPKFIWGNFWHHNLSQATVVFVYLLPWKMDALAKKLHHELRPGTRVISNSFVLPDWKQVNYDQERQVYEFIR